MGMPPAVFKPGLKYDCCSDSHKLVFIIISMEVLHYCIHFCALPFVVLICHHIGFQSAQVEELDDVSGFSVTVPY